MTPAELSQNKHEDDCVVRTQEEEKEIPKGMVFSPETS